MTQPDAQDYRDAHARLVIRNASLTTDRDALLEVVSDMLSGLAYLRQVKRVPYGFGIDRLEETGKAAIIQAERSE